MAALDKSLDDIIKEKREERKSSNNGSSSYGKSRRGGRGGGRGRGGNRGGDKFHPYKEDRPQRERRGSGDADNNKKRRGGAVPNGTVVKVDNLRWEIESADLMDTLNSVEGLNTADVQYDASGRSQGFAILKFSSSADAENFVKDYNGVR
jgi:hypothetical protein